MTAADYAAALTMLTTPEGCERPDVRLAVYDLARATVDLCAASVYAGVAEMGLARAERDDAIARLVALAANADGAP